MAERERIDLLKLALDDVCRFQSQQMDLMHRCDAKAMQLIALYIAVMGAVGTSAITLTFVREASGAPFWVFVGAGVFLTIGAASALKALWTVDVFLPGRKPDFWFWALDNNLEAADATRAYLKQAEEYIAHNHRIGTAAANWLRLAYACGPLSMLGALATFIFFRAWMSS